ncbi:hypothetical protein MMC12_004009 [Toensbergia leucococca]|nr:hypothetical protein [Toensbergia leucococca]
MAGMEQLEIHSKVRKLCTCDIVIFPNPTSLEKSYLVRHVKAPAEYTISWSIQPHKKSINLGVFKIPNSAGAPTPKLPSSTFEPPLTPGLRPTDPMQETSSSRSASSQATEKLKSLGLKLVLWHGTCEPNKITMGKYNVPKGEGGQYALVFDNTFAKQFSKTVTLVLLTYPTSSPPESNHHMHHIQGSSNGSTKVRSSPRLMPQQRTSSDSFSQSNSLSIEPLSRGDSRKSQPEESGSSLGSNFYTGILQKQRRKRHQGYARRFFSLDFTSSTLSYYHDRNTSALRGAIPLSLAAVGANAVTRQISIDSGAEIWHLRANNQKDFEVWKNAIQVASRTATSPASPVSAFRTDLNGGRQITTRPNIEEEQDWSKLEALNSRIASSRDVARYLAKDTDPKYLFVNTSTVTSEGSSPPHGTSISSVEGSPTDPPNNGDFPDVERRPFWKRKPSSERRAPGTFRRSISVQPVMNSIKCIPPTPSRTFSSGSELQPMQSHPEETLHEKCMVLLRNLDSVVSDFSALIAESKRRRIPVPVSTASRLSMDSQRSEEFFDAEWGEGSQLLALHPESDEGETVEHDLPQDEDDSASTSDIEGPDDISRRVTHTEAATSAFPSKPKSLAPLPLELVDRRIIVPSPTVNPPSLIGFLRKNVGKDLSTISMPVSANEPLSLLQRVSEQLEYSTLLDDARTLSGSSIERLLFVSAFAISALSAGRIKERAIRKPFNPMLGESFELVREDRGFRFISEKVSHHPVRLACQAESNHWTLTQSPTPTQKFWGKSVELITEGRIRLILHGTGDRFSWTPATSFLRNIIAGEKYIEPVNTMTIINEATGEQAIATFKSKGMFSGRSEDVTVQVFASNGEELPIGLVGKWTSSLTITENGNPRPDPLWAVADLVPDVQKHYGFTHFAASLNEITAIEKGKLPPTDSRLRPDQRAAEEGEFEQAEVLKGRLEEEQRRRRRGMQEEGAEWVPRWFRRVEVGDGEEMWGLKGGGEGYWEERAKGEWRGVERVFEA